MRAHAVEMEIVKLRGVGTSAIVMKDLLEKHAVRYRYHVIHISRFFFLLVLMQMYESYAFITFYFFTRLVDAETYVKYEQQ